jgi:tetratricopeptide (TPR) repeat protein
MQLKTFFLTFVLFLLSASGRSLGLSPNELNADVYLASPADLPLNELNTDVLYASPTEFAPFPFDLFSGAYNDVLKILEARQVDFKKQNKEVKGKQYAQGIIFLKEKEYEAALLALRNSVDSIGVDAKTLTALAWVAYYANEYSTASIFAYRVTKKNESVSYSKLNMTRGIYLLSQLKLEGYGHCRNLLNEWIDNSVENGEYYLYRAMLCLLDDSRQENNFVNALDDIGVYLIHFPNNTKIQRFKDILKKRILFNSVSFDPEALLSGKLLFPGFFSDMAMNVFRRDRRSEYVLKFLELSDKKEPKNERANRLMFFFYMRESNAASARNCADKLIEMNPSKPYGYFLRGVALRKMGMYNEALQSFEKVLERNIFDTETLQNIAVTYAQFSATTELCRNVIDLMIQYEPFNLHHLGFKLQFELRLDELENAKRTFQQIDALLKKNKKGETLRHEYKVFEKQIEEKEKALKARVSPKSVPQK